MGKVRMIDIAQKVGVSAVTVHNALTGKKGVSDDIREEIKKLKSKKESSNEKKTEKFWEKR